MRAFALTTLASALAVGAAYGREDDGRLGLVRTPHDAFAVVVAPGEAFDVTLEAPAALALVSADARLPLEAAWFAPAEGLARGRCVAPKTCAPGVYALEAVTDDARDLQTRAVHVVAAHPASYRIVHIGAPRISVGEAGAAARERLTRALSGLNAADLAPPESERAPATAPSEDDAGEEIGLAEEAVEADSAEPDATETADAGADEAPTPPVGLAVITGPLTQNGAPEEFNALREILAASAVPVYVAPGPEDMRTGLYEAWFGRPPHVARFGADGLLLFDATDPAPIEDFGAQAGALQQARRDIAGVRWAFGAAHAYALRMGMRAQTALFIDTPLDALLASETDARDETGAPAMPWGQTLLVETPGDEEGGAVRIVEVHPYGVAPLERAAP